MTEPTLCTLCNTNPPMESLQLCNVCMGFTQAKEATPMEKPTREATPMYTCKECGEEFESYRLGPFMAKKVCWPCVRKKKGYTEYRAKGKKAKSKEKTVREPETIDTNNGNMQPEPEARPELQPHNHTIMLDFSRYPWALEWLQYFHNPGAHGVTLEDGMVKDIAERVPADWLKEHLLNNGR